MKFHPFAEVFPLLEGDDFDALVADIKAHGLREKIWLYDGKILDGRNRFLACQKARKKPLHRTFKGNDVAALAFVVSANLQRRHLTIQQRAMAAARIATLQQGSNQHASWEASTLQASESITQTEVAKKLDVGRSSVQRARKIVEHGSKALQDAVNSGEVPLTKAASVTDLPKREQLAAAKAKPPEPDITDWEPEEDEEANLAQAEKDYAASIDKVMAADDRLAAAHAEIKRQAAEIAGLKGSRNQYQNQCGVLIKRVKSLQRENARLKRHAA